jgi:FXSXX-COOH protein
MNAHDEPLPGTGALLPDLLDVDLEELRTIENPVLREVLAHLSERAERPGEMLWGHTNSTEFA